jgi:hypothetical protein
MQTPKQAIIAAVNDIVADFMGGPTPPIYDAIRDAVVDPELISLARALCLRYDATCGDDWMLGKERSDPHVEEIATILIAEEFIAGLRREIGAEKVAEVVRRNDAGTPGTCASHDFCDANMVMLAAVERVLDREMFPEDDEVMGNANTTLANAAWDLAKGWRFHVANGEG